MSYVNLLRVAKRSWAWLAIAVLLGVLGGAAGFVVTSPTYESSAQVLLLPSVDSLRGSAPPNPFLALSSSLQETAAVIATRVTSATTVKDLVASGAAAPFTVTPDDSLNAPVVKIVATSANRDAAQATMLAVVNRFSTELKGMQADAGAPADSMIGTTVISQSPEPRQVVKTVIRNAIALGVLSLLAGLVPLLLRERRSVRAQALAEGASADAEGGLTPPAEAPKPETVAIPDADVEPASTVASQHTAAAEPRLDKEAVVPAPTAADTAPPVGVAPHAPSGSVTADAAEARMRSRRFNERVVQSAASGTAGQRRTGRRGS